MSKEVLIISRLEGAESFAQTVSQQLGVSAEVASNRRLAVAALRRACFEVVVIDESLTEDDPEWADQVWELAGLAIAVQMNFAISGCARLAREVKAALSRRENEHAEARRAAATEIQNELKSSITGLLLESQLALREPAVPAALGSKLRLLVELAESLRERLRLASVT